jgi:CRP-like cAMP-binding protein
MDQIVDRRTDVQDLLIGLGALAHHLQLERGCTALYSDSNGEVFGDNLKHQYSKTDSALFNLRRTKNIPGANSDAPWLVKFTKLLDSESDLVAHRNSVQAQEFNFTKSINPYTYSWLGPILDICVEAALHIENVDPVKVSAYSNFLQWKERAGRERAWGSRGFYSNVFKDNEFAERMISLIEEQGAYERAFFSLATPRQKEKVHTCLSGFGSEYIAQIHERLIENGGGAQLPNISAETWFDVLTGKINGMAVAEHHLVGGLDGQADCSVRTREKPSISSVTKRYLPLIQTLPAFNQLDDAEISNLLSHADVRQYDKGKLLFLQGEVLSRYYIVLEGWVKLYTGTDAGVETVLQMLSAGDSLMEAAVFMNIPSAVSAQVIQKTTLLSFPAPILRNSLLDNKKFARNMIGGLSMRSQSLIRQIEQSRLKTATERVGWFLLRLGLEQSGGRSTSISLPYDKLTIASYLDMRPETFSRTLKKFRAKGFLIENHTIIRPHAQALCQFCDESLAVTCVFKDQDSCPQTFE